MWSRETRQLVEMSCEEDLGHAGDVTSALLRAAAADVSAAVLSRQAGVICGLELGPTICATFSRRLGLPLEFEPARDGGRVCQDGDVVAAGTRVATVRGRQTAVLAVERTLLNFLGRMSGVATLTRRFVEATRAVSADVRILDTRKTIPGWRELDKYAVRTGGGKNHRFGLYDAVLLKDNHLAEIPIGELAEKLSELLGDAFSSVAVVDEANPPAQDADEPHLSFIEVEVDSLEQLAEVCRVPSVDIVLLDNFSPGDLRKAVEYRDENDLRGKLRLEASGGVTLENVAEIAATGVDRISVGALTHSVPNLDIGLDS